ncbi:MAG: hypothetical protein NTW11_01320 [Candidatus Staskawiczbacteria bacterium]|nr:hypothetical protein [Candidatus Staskawiczbacteria bacterium]
MFEELKTREPGDNPDKKFTIKIICSWCEKDMGTKEAEEPGETHSICPDCKKKFVDEFEENKNTNNPEKEEAA